MKYFLFFLFFFFLSIQTGSAQPFERSIALLDLTLQNGEDNDGQLFSAEHILKVTGITYKITADPIEATRYAMIFCSSYIDANTLSANEKISLTQYVSNGGVLVATRVSDEVLYPIFGISGFTESNSNYLLNWNNSITTALFRWINEPEEWTISLGREGVVGMFKTISYNLTSGIALAHYSNNSIAVAQNEYNNGYAYTFGFNWKEVILRSLINRDHEAQRISSNGFEPSMDVIMLLVRAIFNEHIPFSIWKHTSPKNSTSTLVLTHDIDSSTGVDSMYLFSDSEKKLGISANYNMTVRYFEDALMTDFYNGRIPDITKLISDGHIIGAHTVGHFPDFGDDSIFPIGSPGNTVSNYLPYNDGNGTIGGTVWGECEVSKNVLEADLGITVRIFRTGHLVYNKYLVEVLDELGYLYNSSFSANDVLTNFPFQDKEGKSFSGEISNVFELPVSISDVYHADPLSEENYIEKADIWLDITSKIDANNANTVLLIHPNRAYKLIGQEYFLSHLPESICIKEMGAYGDFWREREAFHFTSQLSDKNLQIGITDDDLSLDSEISFIINNGQDLENVSVHSLGNIPIDFDSETWGVNDLILYNFKFAVGTNDLSDIENQLNIHIFPNPVRAQFSVEMDLISMTNITIELLDMFGKMISKKESVNRVSGHQIITFDLNELQLASGIYFCKINVGEGRVIVKKVLTQ